MGISLSLAQLKQYFETWHTQKFDALHNIKLESYISKYLLDTGINRKINDISTGIINIAKFLSQAIDGESNLIDNSSITNEEPNSTDNSSIIDAITELSHININFAAINLKSLSSRIDKNSADINTLNTNKAERTYVDNRFTEIENLTGVIPKKIQTQNIPENADLNDYTIDGLYRSETANITNGLKNLPDNFSSSAFNLVILKHMDNGVRQILLSGGGNNIYTRNYQGSTNGWGEWSELYGEHNTIPLQMNIEWSQGGATTYTILQKKGE